MGIRIPFTRYLQWLTILVASVLVAILGAVVLVVCTEEC
jgi:hypothetical protein